jgi:cytochrome P450
MTTQNAYPLYGPEFKRCPYSTYQQFRDKGEVHPVEFPSGVKGWLVTGYDAAVRTLTDPRLGKNHDLGNDAWRKLAAIMPEPQHSQLQVHLLHQDPPKHTFMRRLVTEALNSRSVEALRPRFQAMAEELLDDLAPVGHGDLVESFSARFPFLVLSAVIGLPPHLARRFRREWCRVVQPVGPRSPHRSHYIGLLHGLQAYIAEVTADRRADPGDDLLSRLVQANDDGRLSDEELSSMIFQLLVAGQEPMTNQINTAMVALLTHPESLEQLTADPALLPRAAEELMRYDGAFELTTWRFFGEESDLFGTRIPAGDSVIVSLAAANRDPARFERADELELTRSPNPHISFGHGTHFCPGAALARTELQIALETILRRLPQLKLATDPNELTWIQAVLGRGVERLPVTFTATP